MSLNGDLNRLINPLNALSNRQVKLYERRIIKEYSAALKEVKAQYNLWLEKNYNTGNIQQLMTKVEKIINDASINGIKYTTRAIKDNFKINYNGVQGAFKKTLNTTEGFSVLSSDTVNAAVFNPYSKINWQSKYVANSVKATETVRSAITRGIITGKGYGEVAKEISHVLSISASDAMRIVSTETHTAINYARTMAIQDSFAAAERLGFTPKKIWNTTGINSRQDHLDLDGVPADETGIWFLGGVATEGPGLSGDPSQDINCKCFITVELEELNV